LLEQNIISIGSNFKKYLISHPYVAYKGF